jgi:hypothetical protein
MLGKIKASAAVSLLASAVLLGCTEPTPDYCQKSSDCTGGRVCDLTRSMCVVLDAGGSLDGARLSDGASGGAAETPEASEAGAPSDAWNDREVLATIDAPASSPVDAPDIDGGIDGPIDVGAVDVMGPDLYVPDAAGTCGSNGDCTDPNKAFCVANVCTGCQAGLDGGVNTCAAPTAVCDVQSGRCVECTADTQCKQDPAKAFCVANACTGCTAVGATGCAGRTDGKTVCAADGTQSGQCVECTGDTDCKNAGKSFCVANVCGGCQTAAATACATRSPSKPVCSTSGTQSGQCVECAGDTDCKDAAKSFCVANACVGCQGAPATACSARSDSKPACATSGPQSGQCVECAGDTDCKDVAKSFCVANTCGGCQTAAATACSARSSSKPMCATSGAQSGQCVACLTSIDCTVPSTPICNTSANTCGACTDDSQCVAKLGSDPGVCMAHQDGRCATGAETLYVASVTGCASSGSTGGAVSQPFCGLQAAVTLMGSNTSKRLIVLRSDADPVSVANATQVSLVAQNAATIHTSVASPGIALSGTGNLYARDLTVVGSAGTNAGISAGPGTTLRLERVKVLDNGGGGILLDGAAFDLNDVLVSGNGTGIDGSTTWSGIYIKALPNAGAAAKLNFVSIVDNGNTGLNCSFALPAAAGSNGTVYASGNGGGVNVIPLCAITACTPALAGTCGSSLTP